MTSGFGNVLDSIGNTPLVELQRIVPEQSARILVKLEGANPTGNMKDRMARTAIQAAIADGRLPKGGTVVEYTGGSTGSSLAFVCAALGHPIKIVTSDAFSKEKALNAQAYGAEVTIIDSHGEGINEALIRSMISTAKALSEEPNHWWFDQLNNADAAAGYHGLGNEIWEQTSGKCDAFVHSVGSAHSFNGVVHALRQHKSDLKAVAVEPAESRVLAGGTKGNHRIEGIGIGFVPPHWNPDTVDETMSFTSEEAEAMCRRLAREEGIFAGVSSGLNVLAALDVAKRLGPGATVVTLMIDTGLRSMSNGVFG